MLENFGERATLEAFGEEEEDYIDGTAGERDSESRGSAVSRASANITNRKFCHNSSAAKEAATDGPRGYLGAVASRESRSARRAFAAWKSLKSDQKTRWLSIFTLEKALGRGRPTHRKAGRAWKTRRAWNTLNTHVRSSQEAEDV